MTAADVAAAEVATRPFADVLAELARGATHTELSHALQRLIGAARETGKKGSITLTVTATPVRGDERQIVLSDSIKISLPEFDRAPSTFFADDDNNLVRDDPRQMHLPLASVDRRTGEVTDNAKESRA
jgi:hypothetical protein